MYKNVMFEDLANIKNNMFEKGYYDIDSIPQEKLLEFIDKDEYIQKYNTGEILEIGNNICFEKFTRTGTIVGKGANMLEVAGDDGLNYKIQQDKAFLKSDVTPFGHWNTMSTLSKKLLLKHAGITVDFSESLWKQINKEVQELIIKIASPAGYTGHSDDSYGTTKPGTFNPVSENKTLAERIKDEMKENEKKD